MHKLWYGIATICVAGLVLLGVAPVASAQNVQNFTFRSFEVDYYLSRNSEGRADMQVVERLTAVFPDFNQNKGIVRAIPRVYDGHTVKPEIVSLKRNNATEPVYAQYNQNNNVVIETGTDDYVRGTQVYEITYKLHDVVKDFGDRQELYWDTNGTEWSQSFGTVVARLHVAEDIASSRQDAVACYKGRAGSGASCDTVQTAREPLIFTANNLAPRENMTFAVSFDPQTFALYQKTMLEKIATTLPIIVGGLGVVGLAVIVWIRRSVGRGVRGRGTIVPEYLPPKDVSVLHAAQIIRLPRASIAAQYIDLAVRHKIKIIEHGGADKDKQGFWAKMLAKQKTYSLELVSRDGLLDDERAVINALFGAGDIGARYDIKPTGPDYTLVKKLQTLQRTIRHALGAERGYYQAVGKKWRLITGLLGAVLLLLAIGQLIFAAVVLGESGVPWALLTAFGLTIVAVGAFGSAATLYPFTEKGRALEEYLKGLKEYIQTAEVDRLRMLQSPEGAAKVSIDTNDKAAVVKLYERVLPYAVLFGQEKEWTKQLGEYYEQQSTQPDWYSGTNAFSSAAFLSSMSSFSTTATSFSTPTSSSSGGSGGGGISGGGGGGGGGGGR